MHIMYMFVMNNTSFLSAFNIWHHPWPCIIVVQSNCIMTNKEFFICLEKSDFSASSRLKQGVLVAPMAGRSRLPALLSPSNTVYVTGDVSVCWVHLWLTGSSGGLNFCLYVAARCHGCWGRRCRCVSTPGGSVLDSLIVIWALMSGPTDGSS